MSQYSTLPDEKYFTRTMTSETLTINSIDGINKLSVKGISGTVTVIGTLKIGAVASNVITLGATDIITFAADDGSALDGITINATAGSAVVIAAS